MSRDATAGIPIHRHSAVVRVTHWINVVCLALLLMSGLQIFNAHPALYWGEISHFESPFTVGEFPGWLTVPSYQSLATGRHWHFLFAWIFVINGAVYLAASLLGGHLWRDLFPTREQLRYIGRSIAEHVRLRFPKGEEARRYNVLQKLAYLAVVLVLLPVMLLAGLAMSPAIDAAFPWLVPLFGGLRARAGGRSWRKTHWLSGAASCAAASARRRASRSAAATCSRSANR